MTPAERRKRIALRRAKNVELAKRDAEVRCAFCRKALPGGYLIMLTASGEALRYCNVGCRRDHVDALQQVMR